MQELRITIRRLAGHKGSSLASIATLACSVGATVVAWSLVSSVLLRPLPVADADRLFVLGTGTDAGRTSDAFIYPAYPRVRDAAIFDRVTAMWMTPERLTSTSDGVATRIAVGFVSQDFFSTLGVPIPLGRGFVIDEDRKGAAPVAVLAYRYWRLAWGASPSVIGRTMTIGGKAVTIIGVAAPGFRGIDLTWEPEIYLPLHTIADVGSPLMNYFGVDGHVSGPTAGLKIVGRLRPSDYVARALARLAAPGVRTGDVARFVLTPINVAALPEVARPGMTRFVSLLAAAVTLLLLIGCGTVGMLLLVRTEARRTEFAVRRALGASVPKLVQGVAIEAAVLTVAGSVCALPLLWWLQAAAAGFDLPGGVAVGRLGLGVERNTMLAWLGASAASLVAITAIASASGFAAGAARPGRPTQLGARTPAVPRRTRAMLVAAQVAVAVVLLAGATLFVKSLEGALELNPGVGIDRVLTTELSLAPHGYGPAQAAMFFDELARRARTHPAVASLAYSDVGGGMGPQGSLIVDGVRRTFPTIVRFVAVDARSFRTIGISPTAGRDFSEADSGGAPRVAIVSESFARLLADGQRASGHRITMPFRKANQPPDVVTIVGIVPDVIDSVAILQPLTMSYPIAQHDRRSTTRSLFIRVTGDVGVVRREVVAVLRRMDPGLAIPPLLTLEERVSRQIGPQRLGSAVLGALGMIALLLTMLGAYVAADTTVTLRMREMGVRAALGATPRQLGALLLGDNTRLVVVGLVIGLGLAWAGSSLIKAFLFEVRALDPATLAGVSLAIVFVTAAAALGPAMRAARLDVPRMLRHE